MIEDIEHLGPELERKRIVDVKVTMYREIPLEYGECPQGIATEVALAKGKAIRIHRRRTEGSYAHASI